MSPSTKNLKERIQDILGLENEDDRLMLVIRDEPGYPTGKKLYGMDYTEEVSELSNLLSSELSLVVKGLREAVEAGQKKANRSFWVADNVGKKGITSGPISQARVDGYDVGYKDALSSFDAKAKEILGESS